MVLIRLAPKLQLNLNIHILEALIMEAVYVQQMESPQKQKEVHTTVLLMLS